LLKMIVKIPRRHAAHLPVDGGAAAGKTHRLL
jgi:hypothetical protein